MASPRLPSICTAVDPVFPGQIIVVCDDGQHVSVIRARGDAGRRIAGQMLAAIDQAEQQERGT